MVGEGVLLECLQQEIIKEILLVGRRHYDLTHPKVKELLVPDFLDIETYADHLQGYDACFFCAGVSSVGMNEKDYTKITYDTTIVFAQAALKKNPYMVFTYVSGQGTDSSESGRLMWARVKGRTENTLKNMGFKQEYNFRPGLIKPMEGQKSMKRSYKIMAAMLKYFFPKSTLTLHEIGRAMIHAVSKGYHKNILMKEDIQLLAEK